MVIGILFALVFKKIGRTPMAYWITVLSCAGAIILASLILSVLKRRTKLGKQCALVSFSGTAFCIVTALFVPSTLISCLFLLGAGVSGLAPVLAKYLK
jgi:chromate transport protein ChrA